MVLDTRGESYLPTKYLNSKYTLYFSFLFPEACQLKWLKATLPYFCFVCDQCHASPWNLVTRPQSRLRQTYVFVEISYNHNIIVTYVFRGGLDKDLQVHEQWHVVPKALDMLDWDIPRSHGYITPMRRQTNFNVNKWTCSYLIVIPLLHP